MLEAVIAEGATTINIPDTVGYAVPELYGEFIADLRAKIPNSDKAVWSVHCHNDLGMAVANSLAGVKIGGARQIECTINGLGERAGNCSLEEVVMAVKTRKDYFQLELGVDATQIVPASRLVSQTTGFVVQPNKAVVGANAFAHASGIHQDGVLKARDTYEIMRAEDVGLGGEQDRPRQAVGPQRLQAAAEGSRHRDGGRGRRQRRVRPLQGPGRPQERHLRRGHPRPGDGRGGDQPNTSTTGCKSLAQHSGTGERPQAKVVFAAGDVEHSAASDGNGPVDASLKAIESKVGSGAEMLLYSVNAITSGSTESQGEVTVRLQHGGRVVNGVGADPDIVVASAKAYLAALNKLHSKTERVAAQG